MDVTHSEDLVLASSKCSQHYYTVLAVFQLTRLRLKSCRSDLHQLIKQRCEYCIQENLPLDLLQWRGELAVLMHQPNHLLRTHLFRPHSDGSLYISCSTRDDAGFGGCSAEQLDDLDVPPRLGEYFTICIFHCFDSAIPSSKPS